MNDGKLIDLVHTYPFLYDRKRSDFKDIQKKNNAWNEISRLMDYSPDDCLNRWKYMREKYSREKKSNTNMASGSGVSFKPPWELQNSLSWLEPHVQKRTLTKTNITQVAPSDEVSIVDEEIFFENDFMENNDPPSLINVQSTFASSCEGTQSANKRFKSNTTENETTMAASLKDMGLAIANVASKMGCKEKNSDDAIGELVAVTLKKFKESRKKNLIKRILNDLMNYSDSE